VKLHHWFYFAILLLSACSQPSSFSAPKSTPIVFRAKALCEEKQAEFISDFAIDSQSQDEVSTDTDEGRNYVTPTKKVEITKWPNLNDDLDLADLDIAIERQLANYAGRELAGTIKFGADVYPLVQAVKSLQVLHGFISDYDACRKRYSKDLCETEFTTKMKNRFALYAPALKFTDPHFGEASPGLFTGYYTPLIHTTTKPTPQTPHAIYTEPQADTLRKQPREKIDFENVLSHRGLELSYAPDLFELYLMQIQGSGHIIVDDAKNASFFADYMATNQQQLNFISIYMKDQGYIDDESIGSQRNYLLAHPEKEREIYSSCPSYVYFRKTQDLPMGSSGVAVTGGRSIATDNRYYPFKGIITMISSQRPEKEQNHNLPCDQVSFAPFSRFFLDQDTGGAVRGKDRADIYFGEGDYAEFAAFNEAERGDIYFFMLKK
jgi:membrane-bound lytic murein transglycosylase A